MSPMVIRAQSTLVLPGNQGINYVLGNVNKKELYGHIADIQTHLHMEEVRCGAAHRLDGGKS